MQLPDPGVGNYVGMEATIRQRVFSTEDGKMRGCRRRVNRWLKLSQNGVRSFVREQKDR